MPLPSEIYRGFKKRLGATCALLELNHLAIAELSVAAKQSGNPKSYVEERARTHGIHVQSSAFDEMAARLSQQSIVVLHAEWEHFLEIFVENHSKETGRKWPRKEKSETLFNYVIENIRAESSEPFGLDEFRIAVIDYFRLARNCAAHPIDEKYEKHFEHARARMTVHRAQIEEHYGSIPADYVKFSLKELIIFSRATQDIAYSLCPSVQPDDAQLLEVIKLKKFNKFQNNKKRQRNAMIGELCTRFGLDSEEAAMILERLAD